MWSDLFTALALVLVIEGIMPFVNPEGLRRMFAQAVQLDNATLRFIGLTSMCVGLVLLYLVR
ncbi:MAG TPA: DUF2065 domain-containing protein [Gammaproteobacteria bacterium]|jgi:uncharacterized protein YjeT (DUF2065 family)